MTPAEKRHAYYLKNRETYLARSAKWQKENPERYREIVRIARKKWEEKNKEAIAQRNKERYKAKHPTPRVKLSEEEKKDRHNRRCNEYAKSEQAKAARKIYYEKKKDDIIKAAKERYKKKPKPPKKTIGQVLTEMKKNKS